MHISRVKDLQEAWEWANEFLLLQGDKILENRETGFAQGSSIHAYNTIIYADVAKINNKFDIADVLGYTDKKWASLLNNYLDLNYLDLIRMEVGAKEAKKAKAYDHTYRFSNTHGSGKDCLISVTFSRRPSMSAPVVTFHTRVSEVTKRLIFDLLLVDRMVKYVFGHNEVSVYLHLPHMYFSNDTGLLYHRNKSFIDLFGKKLIKEPKMAEHKHTTKLLQNFNKLSSKDVETITFQTTRKTAETLQGLGESVPLKLGELTLTPKIKPDTDDVPLDVVTPSERRKHSRKKMQERLLEEKRARLKEMKKDKPKKSKKIKKEKATTPTKTIKKAKKNKKK